MNNFVSFEIIVDNGLIDPTLDLTIDYAELALDEFINNSVIKEIPIVKTFVGLIKVGLNIKEIFFVKKMLTFLKEFHTGSIGEQNLMNFKNKFHIDRQYRSHVVEQITLMNERFISVEKSKIYANLFVAHVNELLDWNNFIVLSAILDNMNLNAIPALKVFGQRPDYSINLVAFDSLYFLQASGLVLRSNNGSYTLNSFGIYFYHYGILADYSKDSKYHKSQTPFYKDHPDIKDLT